MASLNDVPKFDKLISPTVRALKALGGSATNDEIHDKIVELMGLPQGIVEIPYKFSGTLLRYRLHWARTYLKKVGAVENAKRGFWTLNPKGRDMSESDIGDIPRDVRAMDRLLRPEASKQEVDAGDIADDGEIDWMGILLNVLKKMPSDGFERLCQRILRESGFTKVEVTGRSGDGGIDGNGVLRVQLVSFQCKRWKDVVGPAVVRDFRGAMVGRADKGLIMTTGRFSVEARREAIRDGAPAIDLLDGDELCQLLKGLGIGVKVIQVEQIEIEEAFFSDI